MMGLTAGSRQSAGSARYLAVPWVAIANAPRRLIAATEKSCLGRDRIILLDARAAVPEMFDKNLFAAHDGPLESLLKRKVGTGRKPS